ncbi:MULTISPECIES: ribonuclease HII [Arthrobacter]|uniref:ribonuclease HII n=1 Tax=unclassified Arthrobacter TaxID=235627 RepID=UPI0024B9DF05|nr:ribonuclease HII [Arthrobacter sp. H35-MC1]MDJ0316178.1 ribonuclease HII [Arthrobacter sp. H35-MC1]
MVATAPTLEWERELASRGFAVVAGCDEVGRGSLAGPVSVGVVIIRPASASELPGVKDSKLLRIPVRQALVPAIVDWAQASAVGHAAAHEIDAVGLVSALRLAGQRAMAQAAAVLMPDFVILDGNQDWLSEPVHEDLGLFATAAPQGPPAPWQVQTRIKADLTCLSVAAASVLAKVERDGMMSQLAQEFPAFGWESNMGYGTVSHRAAIAQLGPTDHHRKSWRLV